MNTAIFFLLASCLCLVEGINQNEITELFRSGNHIPNWQKPKCLACAKNCLIDNRLGYNGCSETTAAMECIKNDCISDCGGKDNANDMCHVFKGAQIEATASVIGLEVLFCGFKLCAHERSNDFDGAACGACASACRANGHTESCRGKRDLNACMITNCVPACGDLQSAQASCKKMELSHNWALEDVRTRTQTAGEDCDLNCNQENE